MGSILFAILTRLVSAVIIAAFVLLLGWQNVIIIVGLVLAGILFVLIIGALYLMVKPILWIKDWFS